MESALKKLKRKLCTGHDGVPLKIIKDASTVIIEQITELMILASKQIPLAWKKAIVTPLHKSKDKKLVDNYRPVSNLVSMSKVFEKIILQKLDDTYPNLEGIHQHGFRKGRSTLTALLELQSFLAQAMESNSHILTYSVDMSAAFDLLRPGIFHECVKIDRPMMDVLLDFRTGRSLCVSVGQDSSEELPLNVGCVQGSILGPKLFNIYCASI